MEFLTNDLILRTVTENDIKEIARMWEYPHETTVEKAYEALKYMEDTHSKNRNKSICHLCLGVFLKEEQNVIIGWYGGCAKSDAESYRVMQKSGMVQNSFYENGDYIFSIDREAFLNSKS